MSKKSNNKEKQQPDNIYEQWRDLRVVEDHFDSQKASIRQLASGWLLATLGSIAFLLQSNPDKEIEWLIDPYMLISIVALMGIIGISLLWIQDQLVYHRLLNSAALLAMKMEFDHATLPPLTAMMMIFSDKSGMAKLSRLYYLIPIMTLALICIVASCFYYEKYGYLAWLFDGVAIAWCIWVYWRGKTMEKFHERAHGFDQEFIDYLEHENYESQLEKYATAIKETKKEPSEGSS